MANFNPNITPKDTPMADIETNSKGKESCTSFARIDLTRNVDTIDLQEILVAGATTHLEPLSRNAEILERMDPNITIQRLIWTPVSKWYDLKKLSKHNAGLRVAFSKDNAALLCNFVIKTRYPEEARYLGLDLSAPLSNQWLTPTGQQVLTISNCEQKFWLWVREELNLNEDEHMYEPAISFLEPGPALIFGLESGMVMIMKDSAGRVAGALREDVTKECMIILTRPWFVKPRGYGTAVMPRSESGAVTWFYDQEGSREGSVEALDEILDGAETPEFFNFEGEPFS
ncbi:hypothetical protein BKA61DRAFT_576217 [Leptodontidium sp. MPI-SDFR-AT-0119]|nr:hypothetical protein BKA61DRAFT_576217 [Leptodontidium sp. MPI-SDFR-AT-0119]